MKLRVVKEGLLGWWRGGASWTHQNVYLLLLSMTVKMSRYVLGVANCLSLLNFEFQACVVVGNMFQFFLSVWFWFQLLV